ncbi:MAG: DUF4440 domain-containing protein [Erythrobacter sp.]
MIEAILFALAATHASTAEPAPMPPPEEARARIEALDATLFWSAFEGCDPAGIEAILAEDYRMLHDLSGLAIPDREAFVRDLEKQCESRAESGYRNRRLLVPGSRTITPLGQWGIMERGWHTFHEWNAEQSDWMQVGGASYIHIWRWEAEEGRFRLAETISVDHGAAPPYPPEGS